MNDEFTFSFVLPTYNEAENLEILLPKLIRLFSAYKFEIIIVDDGSTDRSVEIINKNKDFFSNIVLIERGSLLGIGSALIDGYNTARGKYIISFDSDLSFSFDGIQEISKTLLTGNYDLVLGSRYLKSSYYEAPNSNILRKKIISKMGNIFLRLTTMIPVHDFSANCRGLKNSVWRKIAVKSKDNFMLFETIWRTYKIRGSIAEVPVKFFDRKFGSSKLRLGKEFFIFFRQFFRLYFGYEK